MGIIERFNQWREKRKKMQSEKELNRLKTSIEIYLAGEMLDKALYAILKAMKLLFLVNKEYRNNIKDFNATYVIQSEDGRVDVTAVFKKVRFLFKEIDGMDVKDTAISNPTTVVTFKDGKAMANFLLSENPDVIEGMLDNQLSVSGNLNYLFKFIYLLWLIPELLGINDFKTLLSTPA